MKRPENNWLEIEILPGWVKWLFYGLSIIFVGYLGVHIYAWRPRGLPMRINGIHLRSDYRLWQSEGRPLGEDLQKFLATKTHDRFVYTNLHFIAGTNYECLFGTRANFGNAGFLVVARGERLIWIDRKTGPELIQQR